MRKHQKTLAELIEENKREILLSEKGIRPKEFEPKIKPANETPQIELLYRDIKLLNDERNQLIDENNKLRRSNAEFGRVMNEKDILVESYEIKIKRLEKHVVGFKKDMASQADHIHKLKNRLLGANAELERLGGERF